MLGRDMLVSFDTYESARERLEKIERKLAVQLSLGGRCTVRRQLIALARSGKLREDELVADWHDAYAAFCDWYRHESLGPPKAIKPFEIPEPITPLTPSPFQPVPEDPLTGKAVDAYGFFEKQFREELEKLRKENAQYMADKIALLSQVRDLEEKYRQLIIGSKASEAEITRLQELITKSKKMRGNVP